MQLEFKHPATSLMRISDAVALTGLFALVAGVVFLNVDGLQNNVTIGLGIFGLSALLFGTAGMWAAVDRQAVNDFSELSRNTSRAVLDNLKATDVPIRRVHVVPASERDLHMASCRCTCRPQETEPCLFVHHSLVRRPSARYKPGDPGWKLVLEDFTPAPDTTSANKHKTP